MLGPLEETLSRLDGQLPPAEQEQLQMVRRNGLRLLKLVNTLLDFSRIEAGRIQAVYEPTDLAAFTTELASVFRAATEQAGLLFVVDCPPLPELVYVDREMWEKIVLNLLSNAFKFTFEGEIAVILRSCNAHIELEVRDTGTGIPSEELPYIFERFHQVKGARGRSYEGSGIGLSLVQELVRLHDGTIEVSSILDQGTCFTVSIPLGRAHLPSECIRDATRTLTSTATGAMPYVEEILRLLPKSIESSEDLASELSLSVPATPPPPPTARILLVDDNIDMRDYVNRLLSQHYEVETAADGIAALAAIRQQQPDLVLTDVMMPGLDGFGLLWALRTNPQTKELPIILLSARAGEEARIAGLEAGADDYLIKPFSARELLARVEATLKLAQLRQNAREREQRLEIATSAAGLGVFEWDAQTDHATWENQQMYEIFGHSLADGTLKLAHFMDSVIHPDDRESFEQCWSEGMKPGNSFHAVCRIRRRDQQWRWIELNGSFTLSPDNMPLRLVGVLGDITERKRTELILVEQGRLLELIAAGQPLDDCLSGLCESISRLNPGTSACFLLTDAQGQTFSRSITPDFPPTFGEGLKDNPINDLCIGTCGEAVYWGEAITCADIANDERWSQGWRDLCIAHGILACHSKPVMDIDRVPLGSLMICFNEARMPTAWEYQLADFGTQVASIVFERERTNLARYESESRFRLMVESAKDYAIFTLDLNGTIVSWNSGAERLLGYIEKEAIGCHGRVIFIPEDNEQGRVEREMQTALTQGWAENERWHVRRDGSRFWASGLMMPLQDEAGHVQGFVKILQDKTAQRQADERFRLLYDTTSDLLATEQPIQLISNLFNKLSVQLDLHFYYNYMVEEKDNRLMLHLKNSGGITDEAAQSIEWIEFGQYLCGLVAQERRQIILDRAQLSIHPNAQLICSMGVTTYAGYPLMAQGRLLGTLSFSSRTRPCFTPEEIDLLQSTCEQMAITLERANLLTSVQQQAEQLQQANRIKDEFLAVLSHELRSPLNPILGWSKLLQNHKLDEARTKQALATIERNAKLQSELIEDLLDVSRILQGKLSLTVNPINLASTIRAALETVRFAAEAKSIQIETRLDPEVGLVSGDSTRLQQVVWNLLSNAVKFTPAQGQVEVRLEQVDHQAQITVSDTGKGIAANFLPYVFEYFRQADSATTRKFGGLGLGLAIVRHLVELHGGTIQADSPGEGLGSTFTVRLPLMPTQPTVSQSPQLSEQSINLRGVQILVVDDEIDTRDFIQFLLEQAGATVITAASAGEALTALMRSHPDILVSDIGMPDMDGYMLMQQVRTLSAEQGGEIPAIALTAYAGEFNHQQALSVGFQRHISKPVEPGTLVRAITKLFRQTTPTAH